MMQKKMIKYVISAAVLAFSLLLGACSGNASSSKTEGVITERDVIATTGSGAENTPGATQNESATGESGTDEPRAALTEIVLATFNIKHGAEGLDKVAQAIYDVSPDIIGLEEVDVGCERSGYYDEPAELAKMAKLGHYAFFKAISLGEGEYGTAILSRYPILSFDAFQLESGGGERRSVGHAVVDIDGMKLDVFVTHLSYEDRTVRISQMKTIGKMLSGCESYALMGDFNCFDLGEITNLGGAYYVNRPDRRYATFRRYSSFSPDNIVVSDNFTEISSAMSDADCSDHRLLYARFLLERR
ncbi:MAG: endonuclease/exonuclease/phosphatase family protein [Clostridia bacterium]|nr:endonuclease/exonuclease/phosphatase family protein [Clostridia bacterium]